MHLRTIEWIEDVPGQPVPGHVRLIDQTRLPGELVYIDTADVKAIWHAIRTLQVRGAPAIGVAAAMGVAAAAQAIDSVSGADVLNAALEAADYLATSRPTAVNLFWALDRMRRLAERSAGLAAGALKERLVDEARMIRDEDAAMCRAIGAHGAALLQAGQGVLTHCNAGGLATAEYGTALAPLYVSHEQGKQLRIFVDETRPLLQGSRLTAWELLEAGIDVTLICDSMAAQVMKEGQVNAVMVGADRIAANGDVANKIGTYGLALLARAHEIPFYALAPTTTFDLSLSDGEAIPIEMRSADEVTQGFGSRTAPERVHVYSPAFDVTPAHLVTAIVCERGIARAPYKESLAEMVATARECS